MATHPTVDRTFQNHSIEEQTEANKWVDVIVWGPSMSVLIPLPITNSLLTIPFIICSAPTDCPILNFHKSFKKRKKHTYNQGFAVISARFRFKKHY